MTIHTAPHPFAVRVTITTQDGQTLIGWAHDDSPVTTDSEVSAVLFEEYGADVSIVANTMQIDVDDWAALENEGTVSTIAFWTKRGVSLEDAVWACVWNEDPKGYHYEEELEKDEIRAERDALRAELDALKASTVTVIVEMDAGVINCVSADKSVRVIILDLDTEGGDEDQIATIGGVETYISDFEAEIDAPDVADTARQVDAELARAVVASANT